MTASTQSNKKLITYLVLGCLGMFGFGFALVPLYDIMCDTLGINGKTATTAQAYDQQVINKSRTIRIEFMAHIQPGMKWDFGPTTNVLEVHPGELVKTAFVAKNNASKRMIAQAIPSISPGLGAKYFHKTECFCFQQQPVDGQSPADFPLVFFVDPQLPKDIHTLTLSYTLYDITEKTLGEALTGPQAQGVTP
ncbi:cytochrome c oxidase assembly protein [Parashewanella curva]|uniref:Cytochrome c oxidase assembly protein CtaG n=1 Tax=Parashewanella curva TaxID=2338552 RepID=A0A3L8PXM2_9GAMM|nr:cytochrome c oxidase assembly protein [Parashewanella curva]RLV59198.1 cytochrome c oxidase assembly protein [Parashewanella curva]